MGYADMDNGDWVLLDTGSRVKWGLDYGYGEGVGWERGLGRGKPGIGPGGL